MTLSLSSMSRTGSYWQRLATRLRCVSMTPFGNPVVPLENGSATRCVAGSMSGRGAGVPAGASSSSNGVVPAAAPIEKTSSTPAAAAVAFSKSSGTVTNSRAPESSSWVENSSTVINGLAVVFTPPAVATP